MAYLQGFGPEADYLRGRFFTQWKTARSYSDAQMGATNDKSDVRVAWGNRTITPPNAVPWVRFRVTHAGAEQASTGSSSNPLHRHDGMVIVEVFVPLDSGEGTIDDYCDTIAGMFRNFAGQQGLRFHSPSTADIGATDDGWYKKDVLIPFVRDTVFT